MNVVYRVAEASDVDATFEVRANTRQSAASRTRLFELGITPENVAEAMASGDYRSFISLLDERVVGFCNADARNGEIVVLAIHRDFERLGMGLALLTRATDWLRARGWREPWLMAGRNPGLRAHAFYRRFGFMPSGVVDITSDDEELILLTATLQSDSAHPINRD